MRALQAMRGKRRRHNLAGKHFAESGDVIGGARRELADRRNAAQQFVEPLEVGSQFRVEVGKQRRAQQFAGGVVVSFLQRPAEFERRLALPGSRCARHGQQRVGDLGHGADHHHRLLRQAAFDDRGHALDGPRVFHRSAAEFHHDHRRDSLGRITEVPIT